LSPRGGGVSIRAHNMWVLIQKVAWAVIGVLSVILILVAFIPKLQHYQHLQRVEAEKSGDVRQAQDALDQLKQDQQKLRTSSQFVEKVAREEHQLAKPNELLFKFVDDDPAATNKPPRRK
jgi:cell division protein FtsB